MAITQTITVLPTPPSRADPANFDTRADSFLSALPTMQTQMNTWAGQANSTASEATGAAGDAEAAQAAAEAAQSGAVAAQGTATTQAGIATTQAGIATTQAGTATTQAGIATTQAGIATTQAGIATTKAGEAAASAALAVDVVSGGLTSTTPAANKIPLADGAAKIALGWLDLTGYAPASHAHGNITAAGAIGSTANLPVITTTSGALTVGAFGTGATNFTAGNDARLSDARTPTAHNQAETTITFTDVATGNASTTAHGFAPKAAAPASGLRSVMAIDNGETVRSDKALFDATNPAALGTASPGSAMTAARRDHVHALPEGGASVVISTTPPATPAAGDLWWDSESGQMAIYYTDADTSQWVAIGGPTGAAGAAGAAGANGTTEISFSIPTVLVVGAGAMRWYVDADYTITNVMASVGTAPTGASLIFDVNKNGTTIFTTQGDRPTITASAFSDLTSTPAVTSLASGDYLTVDVDQIGSTVAGANAVIRIKVV